MGIFFKKSNAKVPRLDLELTPGCDHKCGHCYNVWNAKGDDPQSGYPRGQLKTDATLRMIEKAVKESGAEHITVTGGEPLLRKDALDIIAKVCELVPSVQLITNGSHITPEVAQRFRELKVRAVQLTLLSADPDRHNELKGADCFDDTVRAALDLIDARVPVQVCFVAMAQNWQDFADVMELCFALGVRSISYNRMSPTGWAIHEIDRLMPLIEQVEQNLDTAESLGPLWDIQVATAMPIPPCLIRIERYKWVKFGFCSVGTESPNITIDALGNVRSCNLSSHIMGNILVTPFDQIYKDKYFHSFQRKLPPTCQGCHYQQSCQGGCKESAFATYGDLCHPEPLLQRSLQSS